MINARLLVFLFGMVALIGNCFRPNDSYASISEQTIEYQVSGNEFVVVVVETDELSKEQARKFAKQRAAEIAFENGYRYIVIESEKEVMVTKSDRPFPDNQAFPGNLYQELIIEGNMGKGSVQREMAPQETLYRGYRVDFKAYEEMPAGGIDVCSLTHCK